ncbi:HNH endonuclease domain-containing protein [Clostridium sp.]|jgi:hypothetical protein|uniref:HNH endonuclease domain-containing protein n=1 Tax=Clostridium sp. TaxID=1506 RepID=UPI003EF03678
MTDLNTFIKGQENASLDQINIKDITGYLPINNLIDSRIFSRLLDDDKMVASYKMYWLIGILEEVSIGNTEIEFKKLIARMIASAWYPQQQFKLNFGFSDNLKKPIGYVALKNEFPVNCNEKELLEFLYKSEDKELNRMMKELTYNVPYRLLSPFFKILEFKNNSIVDLSQGSETCLYKIIKGDKDKIVINDCWVTYLKENYRVIKSWIYYKLVCFLQKRNPNVPAIVFKLEAPKRRMLKGATELWKQIISVNRLKDIYTGSEFSNSAFQEYGVLSIDHFIPWSFVLHDQMWNLVPTFKNVNSKKSDKLLLYDNYIDDFCSTQYKAFSYICNKKIKHSLEEYVDVLNLENPYEYFKHSTQETFSKNIKQCISPLYQIALNQGFQVVDRVI